MALNTRNGSPLLLGLALTAAALLASGAGADERPGPSDAGPGFGIQLAGTEDPSARKVYIVQLAKPSAAEYHAATHAKMLATAAPAGKIGSAFTAMPKFDRNTALIKDYTRSLAVDQERVLSEAGPTAELIYSYRYGLNGFAAELTPAAAHKLASLPGVVKVWEDEIRPLATNFSPEFLGLYDGDKGLRSAQGLSGEDVVVAIIDSGVYPEHPALQDTQEADRPRLCRSTWGENSILGRWLCRKYRRAEDRVVYEPLEDWSGTCQTGEDFEAEACNNKLIGARWFIDGAETTGPIDTGEIRSPRDVDGHGTHIATTAAGNRVTASIFGTRIGNVEGIAPRARVAIYKACWLRPGETRASCNTSDLANAIDAAVADGVDIINYSIGTSTIDITAPDDVALMNATKAGVLAVVAAGNDGPNIATTGSPAGGPWALTVAASTRDGQTSREALEITAPPSIAGRYAAREASFTPPLADVDPIEADVVLADDDTILSSDGTPGTRSDACEALVNDDEMDGAIALIARGGCDFDVKIANAEDAGAVAAVIYNLSDEPIVMQGNEGLSNIPALMIGQADGNLIIAELDADNVVSMVLDKGFFLEETQDGNSIAQFSSRGPGPEAGILKPDVTAPGVDILAGNTPEAVNTTSGETFAYLSGTSMSTPHVAGIAALIKEARPSWSPEAIKSALMTTARQDITRDNDGTPAIPFDFGSGHVVANDALDPGLVYETSSDEYDAFACGTDSPGVDGARCDQLAADGFSFAPEDLNQPNIAISQLASQQTVTRRVSNLGEQSETYVVEIAPPAGVAVQVVPATLSLGPGETGSYEVTLSYQDGDLDQWRFGSLTWQSTEHAVRSVLAVRPVSIVAPAEITTFGGSGDLSFEVQFGYSGGYQPRVHGLRLPLVIDGFVDNDPTKTFTFRGVNGVTSHLIDIPADQLYLRFALFDALTDGDDDLDMYVYYCLDNVACSRIGESGEATSQERFDLSFPAAGRYAVLIHGFETDEVNGGTGANYQLLGWSFGINDDRGNATVSGPPFATAGTTGTIDVNWSNLGSQTIYFGGISHNTPGGLTGLTLLTIGN
ncbi:MAG: S8 family serine peptidase [Pseudomonadota bacterium]